MGIMEIINSFSDPKQAIDTMLNKMPSNISEPLKVAMTNGKDPKEALKEYASQGKINMQSFNQLKSYYKKARMLGFKAIKIDNATFDELENIIRNSGKSSSNTGSNFRRF